MMNRVIKNASWIVFCKIIQSLLSFIIGMFTARYLGPSNFGLISYASSIVAFFIPIMQLGFTSTLVQEIIANPESEGTVLGTSLILNIVSGVVSVLGVTAFSIVANPNEEETVLVCFLYSLTLIFQASEMTQYWFQAKLFSKYPSIVSLIAYIIVSIYKVYILVLGKSIFWFAITHVIEAFVISTMLIFIYRRMSKQKLKFSFLLGKEMFSRSKYYISSGLMVVIFQQTDRIMLKLLINEAETGYYSAALTCIGVTGFVFTAIIDSARPSILESKKYSDIAFQNRMKLLFMIITIFSFGQSIGMTLLANPLVNLLYGEEYLPAAQILRIAVWYVTFGYYGVVRNIWILAEGKQKYLWIINLLGAALNVIGNAVLIPLLGACGAAIASFATQFFTNFILCFLIKPIRPVGKLILNSLNLKLLIGIFKYKTIGE